MYESVRVAVPGFTRPIEGSLDVMYLDQHRNALTGALEPLVTTGDGDLIDRGEHVRDFAERAAPALALQWTRIDGGAAASPAEVVAEFRRVTCLASLALRGGGAFRKSAQLRVTQTSLQRLHVAQLVDIDARLRAALPKLWDELPADAQLALVDMALAMGTGYTAVYLKMMSALRARDWVTVAAECAITHPRNDAIRTRNHANALLFANAGAVDDRGLDPAVLYWPTPLDSDATAAAVAAVDAAYLGSHV